MIPLNDVATIIADACRKKMLKSRLHLPVPKNVKTETKERFDHRASPQRPWPEVHPHPIVVPNPTRVYQRRVIVYYHYRPGDNSLYPACEHQLAPVAASFVGVNYECQGIILKFTILESVWVNITQTRS